MPAGKMEKREKIRKAMRREGDQETKINLRGARYINKVFVKYPDKDFIYHMFAKRFKEKPPVIINPEEHKAYLRIDRKEALKLDLIQDLDECIRMVYPETR